MECLDALPIQMKRINMRAVCAHIAVAALASLPAVTLASTNDEALAIALASSGEPVEQTLSPDQAFLPTVKQIGRDVELKFAVAAGYHLYRDKIRIETSPTGSLSDPVLPAAEERVDRVLGRQKVFSRDTTILLTVEDGAPKRFKVTVRYQGCAGVGVCYPPQTAHFTVKGTPSPVKAISSPPTPPMPTPTAPIASAPEPAPAAAPLEETNIPPAATDQRKNRGLMPSWLGMVAVATVAIVLSVFLNAFEPLRPAARNRHRFAKGFGLLLFLFGAAQLVGVFAGGRSLLAPLGVLLSAR
ncbi:thiol:disulfide interchange protein [Cupriavidus metallidurans]|uniref:protein-disulfide reductase DsbD N-terminal domain-containing protein n=1 Tax=Cupriavidus metallidurans TaxID=119219 RepID=UPI00136407C5|nr:protein-disulfide reductase DsbD N-terminal domain-containing protein [Cupriavidus metallidurans]